MKGKYSITLNLAQPIQTSLLEVGGLRDAIKDAGLILKDASPTYIRTKDDGKGTVSLRNYSVAIESAATFNVLEVMRYALETAKRLEAETSSLAPPLIFNPNLIMCHLGLRKDAIHKLKESTARKLQRHLYGGGSVAYYESSGDHKLILGVESEFPKGVETLKAEGTAQPVSSLDELLQRLEQKRQ